MQDSLNRAGASSSTALALQSPQVLDGGATTHSDDIYSVGVLLFELLSGVTPYAGALSADEFKPAVPQKIADNGPTAIIPPVWEETIQACLEKQRETRPKTTSEIAQRLVLDETKLAVPSPAKTEAVPVEVKPTPVKPEAVEEKSDNLPPKESPADISLNKKSSAKSATPLYARPSSNRSRSPTMRIALAAVLILAGIVGYRMSRPELAPQDGVESAALTPSASIEGSDLRSVNNEIEPPQLPIQVAPVPSQNAQSVGSGALPAPIAGAQSTEPVLLAAASPTPAPRVETSSTALPATAATSMGFEDKAVAEKSAALDAARQAIQAAEKARAELVKQQQQAELIAAEAQKAFEAKTKAAAPLKKAADETLALRKKLEEEQAAAEAAAQQAQKSAADKLRFAEEAKKAVQDFQSKTQEKLTAQEKADSEIREYQAALSSKQQAAAEKAKAVIDADAARQQRLAALKQGELDLEQARTVAAEAQRVQEVREAERRKLDQELADMQDMFKKKMAEIEARRKSLEVPSTALPSGKAPEPAPAGKTPERPAATPPSSMPPTSSAPVAVPPPAIQGIVTSPSRANPEPVQLAMKTTPDNLPPTPTIDLQTPSPAIVPGGNSLGMVFAPVGNVEFCIWQTRVKDFETFAKAVNLRSTGWKTAGFSQGPDHPVVNVTWQEAIAFCKWLTDAERKAGLISANQFYRLPTDLEWSRATGLPEEPGKTPESRDMGIPDVYPWGTQWPPPPGSGNYTGEETGSDVAIKGYDDGFAWTSPVGSFAPNKAGLYDMGGNVWQWCMDTWNAESKAKVLRGASWYNGALKLSLLSSCRVHAAPDSSTDNYGFRVVRAVDTSKAARK
ncbi:MAG: SUMF1/EgtB/PvdO family nonheme iron enzyme [Bryobacteraceae bacterium]|nr:SUMF1/EgtB/PvdO family nonheme iron enzyme [Bryobacteraceae bacterium]